LIVLDTNVISEAMRPRPDPRIIEWLDTNTERPVVLTSITIAELLLGMRILEPGKRRSELERRFEMLLRGFRRETLAFDEAAADAYSEIAAARKRAGRPMRAFDAMIAGIAVSRNAEIATRDISDFEGCGAQLINPWEATADR
jgi:toxin FitB